MFQHDKVGVEELELSAQNSNEHLGDEVNETLNSHPTSVMLLCLNEQSPTAKLQNQVESLPRRVKVYYTSKKETKHWSGHNLLDIKSA